MAGARLPASLTGMSGAEVAAKGGLSGRGTLGGGAKVARAEGLAGGDPVMLDRGLSAMFTCWAIEIGLKSRCSSLHTTARIAQDR